MTIFTIDNENSITAFATAEAAAAASQTPFDLFTNRQELAELVGGWPTERLVETDNSLPGVKPVKSLKDPKAAASKIWERVEKLGQLVAEPEAPKVDAAAAKPEPPAKPKAAPKGKGGAQAAKGAPAKGKASKKATPAKPAPKGKKGAKTAKEATPEASAPRGGSKMAEVIAMMQRAKGATITEVMSAMGWQRHTVRGFVAGALKKAGYNVESFKPEGGERSYRINK